MGQPSPQAPDIRKKIILFLTNLVGLLLVRAIVGGISTVKNSSPFGDSLMTPLLLFYAIVDSVLLVVIIDFGIMLAGEFQARHPEICRLRSIMLLFTAFLALVIAYRAYETPVACLITRRTALTNSFRVSAVPGTGKHTAATPGDAPVQGATGESLVSYQRLAVTSFRQSPDIYGWIFLFLVSCPLIAIAVLVSRNPHTFVDFLSQLVAAARTKPQLSAVIALPKTLIQAYADSGPALSREEMMQKIATLSSLRDSRSISDADFEEQKKNILARAISDSKPVEPQDFEKLKSLLESGALTQDENHRLKSLFLKQI